MCLCTIRNDWFSLSFSLPPSVSALDSETKLRIAEWKALLIPFIRILHENSIYVRMNKYAVENKIYFKCK